MSTQHNRTYDYRIAYRNEHGSVSFAVYEAMYDQGKLVHLTADPVYPVGESLGDLQADLASYLKSWDLPIIDYETLEIYQGPIPLRNKRKIRRILGDAEPPHAG